MAKLKSSVTKKTLIITGVNEEIYPLFPLITNKKNKDTVILNSFGAVISQPYGCLMRNIILALYKENVEEIYIIVEMDSKEINLNKEEILCKIMDTGASVDIIHTINYMDVVDHDLINWLVGPQNMNEVMKKNKDLIKNHPLIPKSIPIHAYMANPETGEYYSV